MKHSEARILVYISQVPKTNKNVSMISTKLDIGYNYLCNILRDMTTKKWLFKHRLQTRMFYNITELGKQELKQAKEVLKNGIDS